MQVQNGALLAVVLLWLCVGLFDHAEAEKYIFIYGSGGFKGISGKTPFVGSINIKQRTEGRIYGYAHWPKLTYSLP